MDSAESSTLVVLHRAGLLGTQGWGHSVVPGGKRRGWAYGLLLQPVDLWNPVAHAAPLALMHEVTAQEIHKFIPGSAQVVTMVALSSHCAACF